MIVANKSQGNKRKGQNRLGHANYIHEITWAVQKPYLTLSLPMPHSSNPEHYFVHSHRQRHMDHPT